MVINNPQFKNIQNNQGIALVIALVFLFVSTLLGVSALRTSLLNERMTLNSVQRDQALEAAEAALLAGEEFVADMSQEIIDATIDENIVARTRTPTAAATTCTALNGGVCVPSDFFDPSGPNNWDDIDSTGLQVWRTTGRHRTITDEISVLYDLNTTPKFIVEFLGFVRNAGDNGETACINPTILWQLSAWPYCSLDAAQFRITAFATSGNFDQTRVMLQTTYVVN